MDKSNGRASKRKQVRNSKRDDEWDKIARSFIEGVKDVIEDFVSKITTCWYRSTKAIFDTATICKLADEQLSPAQKKKLLKRLPFGESTFSKLVQIGKDQRIPKSIKRLPPSMSTMYEVTLLSDEQLEQAKEADIISAEATRDSIKLFRESGKPALKADGPSKPAGHQGAPNKTHAAAGTSEPADDFDDSFDDDEEFLEDDQEGSEESIEGDDAYDAVVGEWRKQGLRRTKWQALPKSLRQKFIKDVLLREPFKSAA
jgi:hypothetical protein